MKHRNWFWGIFFLLAAVFVIASQTGSFGEIGLLSITATVLLAALIIHSLANRNFFGVFVPLAFVYMIYQGPLDLMEISTWILIVASIFASIGFEIFFGNHHKFSHPQKREWHHHKKYDHHEPHERFNQVKEDFDGNDLYAKVSFGSSSKYVHSDCLKSGQFFVSFGALEVFFDQAVLSPDGAEIFLDCSFGAITLYIPRSWRVQDNLHASLGGVENDAHSARPSENAPLLILTGNVSLGGIEIKYI
jgi:predicted membrane protein